MTRKPSHLKVATAADAEPKPEPKNLQEAAEASERDLLVMMREKAAREIDNGVPPAYLAPIMRQIRELDREIRLMDEKAQQEAEEDAAAGERRTWDEEAI